MVSGTEMKKAKKAEWNRQYYDSHKKNSFKKSLMFDVRRVGRVPSVETISKYELDPLQILIAWRQYRTSVTSPNLVKRGRMLELLKEII